MFLLAVDVDGAARQPSIVPTMENRAGLTTFQHYDTRSSYVPTLQCDRCGSTGTRPAHGGKASHKKYSLEQDPFAPVSSLEELHPRMAITLFNQSMTLIKRM